MADPSPGEVTQLLSAWSQGDRGALDRLLPLIESELHKLALRFLSNERPGHTLQATALINEAYLRLVETKGEWRSRSCFFATAATIMRRILVDHARRRGRQKRGPGAVLLSLDEVSQAAPESSVDVIALDEALDKLSCIDPRKSQIVELRFFGGLAEEEVAAVMGDPLRTIQREWSFARAWLFRQVQGQPEPGTRPRNA